MTECPECLIDFEGDTELCLDCAAELTAVVADDVSLATAWLKSTNGQVRFNSKRGWQLRVGGDKWTDDGASLAVQQQVMVYLSNLVKATTFPRELVQVLLSSKKRRTVVDTAALLSDCTPIAAIDTEQQSQVDRNELLTARQYLGDPQPGSRGHDNLKPLGYHAGRVGRGHGLKAGRSSAPGPSWSQENTWPRWVWDNAVRIMHLERPIAMT